MPRPEARRSLAALAVSLLVHALAFGWLAAHRGGLEPVAPPAAIEVELVELPEPPAPAPAPAQVIRPHPTRRPAEARAPSPSAPVVPQPAAPLTSGTLSPDAPVADSPTAQRFIPVPSPSLSLALPPADTRAPSGLRAPAVPDDILGEAVRDTIGRAKVDRGLVHPYYTALGKQLIKSWDADRAVSRRGLRGFAEQLGENSKVWNGIWLEHAAAFGASGTPLTADSSGDRPRPPSASERLDPNLAARREVQKQMRQQMRATRRATLKVVQDSKGVLLSVELIAPSNDPHVDNEALADIRSAAQKLPPPPAEATRGRDRLVSIWLFELVISITPPVPTFSFEFDEALGFIDTRLPLDRRIYKRVKLISVD